MGKVKRKSLLTEEQQALLDKFQKPNEKNDEATSLSENSKTKATSAGFKPMVNRSGSRGK